MVCTNCGAEIGDSKFCTECGTKVGATPEASTPQSRDEALERALENLKKFEEGTIEPDEEVKVKRKPFCWKNPVLGTTVILLIATVLCVLMTVIFFNIENTIPHRIIFIVLSAALLALTVLVYLPNAFRLDKMLRGKDVKFEYRIREEEIEPLAKKARKKNRIWYLIVAIVSLGFTSYYAYLCATAVDSNAILWTPFWFCLAVFAVSTAMFFLVPILNYNRMMENGKHVIIGEKAVYYGGQYHHWFGIEPMLTYGKYNSKTNEFTLTFTKVAKDGSETKKKVEMYAPIKESNKIMALLDVYEAEITKYRAQKRQNAVFSAEASKENEKK